MYLGGGNNAERMLVEGVECGGVFTSVAVTRLITSPCSLLQINGGAETPNRDPPVRRHTE